MQKMDSTMQRKPLIEFEPILLPDVDSDELPAILDGAESSLHRFKKMLEALIKADSVTDDLNFGTWECEFLYENTLHEVYEDSVVDITHSMRLHLQKLVAQFTLFCSDIESEIDVVALDRETVRIYGSQDDQVRRLFNRTRI